VSENQHDELVPERAKPTLSRRSLLVGGASTAAAGVIGVAAGIGVGGHEVPPAPHRVLSRQRFTDKVVMITGATSGIGRAAAIAFAREGAKVAFCGRRRALGHEVVEEIADRGGTARYYCADVRIEADMQRFVDFTLAQFGRLDVAFNNAGITLEKPLHEYSAAEWDDVLNTNLRGVFFAIKYQIPVMLAAKGATSSSPLHPTPLPRKASVEPMRLANAAWLRSCRPLRSNTAPITSASTPYCPELPIQISCDESRGWRTFPTLSGRPQPRSGRRVICRGLPGWPIPRRSPSSRSPWAPTSIPS
jgi:hypothetical protein